MNKVKNSNGCGEQEGVGFKELGFNHVRIGKELN